MKEKPEIVDVPSMINPNKTILTEKDSKDAWIEGFSIDTAEVV